MTFATLVIVSLWSYFHRRSAHSEKRLTKKVVSLVAAVTIGMLQVTGVAKAEDSERYLTITLVGDSYTAGNGAGNYYESDKFRSTRNWGHTYAKWLNGQGVHTIVHNLAVSGAVTSDMIREQIPNLDHSSNLVMFTAGGNDVGFSKIVQKCYVFGYSYTGCKEALDNADAKLPAAKAGTEEMLDLIADKLYPRQRNRPGRVSASECVLCRLDLEQRD